MNRTYISDVKNTLGETIKVQGFIENLRNSKYMAFIVLKDITGKIQVTVEKEKLPELCDTIDSLTGDSVITVVGTAVENEYVKMGGIEIIPESIVAESIADALPIARKEMNVSYSKYNRCYTKYFSFHQAIYFFIVHTKINSCYKEKTGSRTFKY